MSPPESPSAGLPGPGPSGAIYDIGYRHYDGPRLSRGQIAGALYLDSLRGAFGLGRSTRSKIMPFLLLSAAVLPALIVAVVASLTRASELPLDYVDYLLAITLLVALFVAGQAPAAISRDLRFRTISLYFATPLRRSDYVRAKYAALASAVMLFCSVPLLTLYAGALLIRLPVWDQTRDLLAGLAGAALTAAVVTGISLTIAALTPRRGVGVAAVITVLIVAGGVQAALQSLGEQQGNPTLAGYSGLIDPFTLVKTLVVWAFSLGPSGGPVPPEPFGGPIYLAATVALVTGSYAALVRRYRRVSVS